MASKSQDPKIGGTDNVDVRSSANNVVEPQIIILHRTYDVIETTMQLSSKELSSEVGGKCFYYTNNSHTMMK